MKEHAISSLQARMKIQRLKFLFLLKNNKLSMSPQPYLMPITTRRIRHHHDQCLTPHHAKINTFKYSFFPVQLRNGASCLLMWLWPLNLLTNWLLFIHSHVSHCINFLLLLYNLSHCKWAPMFCAVTTLNSYYALLYSYATPARACCEGLKYLINK